LLLGTEKKQKKKKKKSSTKGEQVYLTREEKVSNEGLGPMIKSRSQKTHGSPVIRL